ncbi:MAG: hypothetical protein IPI79_15320 [Moraxellaceae bacterium]|nr:hypothetical protein [Moraxellaceae bacterium]
MVSIIAGGVRYRGILGEITAVSDKNGVIKYVAQCRYVLLKIAYPQADEMLVDATPSHARKHYNYALTGGSADSMTSYM